MARVILHPTEALAAVLACGEFSLTTFNFLLSRVLKVAKRLGGYGENDGLTFLEACFEHARAEQILLIVKPSVTLKEILNVERPLWPGKKLRGSVGAHVERRHAFIGLYLSPVFFRIGLGAKEHVLFGQGMDIAKSQQRTDTEVRLYPAFKQFVAEQYSVFAIHHHHGFSDKRITDTVGDGRIQSLLKSFNELMAGRVIDRSEERRVGKECRL